MATDTTTETPTTPAGYPLLTMRQIRILCDESAEQGFEEMLVAVVRTLACRAHEGDEITTELFQQVASDELAI